MKKVLLFILALVGTLLIITLDAHLRETKERAKVQTQCHALYAQFLHELWINNPQFIEKSITESATFKKIQELKQNDFEDEFLFHGSQDSIKYYSNGGKYGELLYLYE